MSALPRNTKHDPETKGLQIHGTTDEQRSVCRVVVVVVVYLRTFLELGVLPIGSGSAIRQIDRLRSSAQLKYRGMSSNAGPARYQLIA